MSQLISIRTNIFYTKEVKDGEEIYVRHQELIFLIEQPTYSYSNEGEVVRQRGVREVRFTVNEKGFDQLIELLQMMKDVEPSELA